MSACRRATAAIYGLMKGSEPGLMAAWRFAGGLCCVHNICKRASIIGGFSIPGRQPLGVSNHRNVHGLGNVQGRRSTRHVVLHILVVREESAAAARPYPDRRPQELHTRGWTRQSFRSFRSSSSQWGSTYAWKSTTTDSTGRWACRRHIAAVPLSFANVEPPAPRCG